MSQKHSALVIGAGVAGLQSSLELAQNGFEVHLVEKESQIGGTVTKLSKLFPTLKNAREVVKQLIEIVVSNPNIKILFLLLRQNQTSNSNVQIG